LEPKTRYFSNDFNPNANYFNYEIGKVKNEGENINNKEISEKSKTTISTNFKKNKKTQNIPIFILRKKFDNFQSLGIYYIYNNEFKKKLFFDVYYRNVHLTLNNSFDDFFFEDVTDLINHKQIIIDENLKKQKVLAKIAHEFKTPLNSVIGIAANIKDSDIMLSNNTSNKLDIIQNLSNYLIFLVSDIIQFTSKNNFSNLNFNNNFIDLKETLNFCFQILNSLLTLNKRKNECIVSELRLSEFLDTMIIESDEIRIKQILLNFISNAVKFTREGKIILKAKKIIIQEKTYAKISIKDTGIGIKEEDKELLFEEFKMIENINNLNKINNSCGSGLGLNICKSLCKKLNIELKVKSTYLSGSTFSIIIPSQIYSNFNLNQLIITSENKRLSNKNIIKIENCEKIGEKKLENCDYPDYNSNLMTLPRNDIVPLNIDKEHTYISNSLPNSSNKNSARNINNCNFSISTNSDFNIRITCDKKRNFNNAYNENKKYNLVSFSANNSNLTSLYTNTENIINTYNINNNNNYNIKSKFFNDNDSCAKKTLPIKRRFFEKESVYIFIYDFLIIILAYDFTIQNRSQSKV